MTFTMALRVGAISLALRSNWRENPSFITGGLSNRACAASVMADENRNELSIGLTILTTMLLLALTRDKGSGTGDFGPSFEMWLVAWMLLCDGGASLAFSFLSSFGVVCLKLMETLSTGSSTAKYWGNNFVRLVGPSSPTSPECEALISYCMLYCISGVARSLC